MSRQIIAAPATDPITDPTMVPVLVLELLLTSFATVVEVGIVKASVGSMPVAVRVSKVGVNV